MKTGLASGHLRWNQGDFKEVHRETKNGDSKRLHGVLRGFREHFKGVPTLVPTGFVGVSVALRGLQGCFKER